MVDTISHFYMEVNMKQTEYYYKYLKGLEKEREDMIQKWFRETEEKERIQKIARDAAKEYIDSQQRNIQIEVDKRSISELENTLRNLF